MIINLTKVTDEEIQKHAKEAAESVFSNNGVIATEAMCDYYADKVVEVNKELSEN